MLIVSTQLNVTHTTHGTQILLHRKTTVKQRLCSFTSKPITMTSLQTMSYFWPQEDVNAIRHALVTTPTMFKNSKTQYHVPEKTTTTNWSIIVTSGRLQSSTGHMCYQRVQSGENDVLITNEQKILQINVIINNKAGVFLYANNLFKNHSNLQRLSNKPCFAETNNGKNHCE